MRLGKRHILLLGRYLLTVSTLGMLASDIQGQSKTAVSNFTSVASPTTSSPIRPLSIGDQVPDIVFENVLNYKSKKAKLSDFRGKLVILDMWSVYCTSCIAAFPEMEKLQKEFGDKIQILLVNPHDPKYDSEEKIKSTLEKLKVRTGYSPKLPIPIHDSILNLYFPHQSVPHQIWINGQRKVVAITGPIETTVENINSILKNEKINVPLKNDWALDKEEPLPVGNNDSELNDIIYRSVFTKYRGGIGFGSGIRKNAQNAIVGIYRLNEFLMNFISEAYSSILTGTEGNRIILDVENPTRFKTDFDTSIMYCYDLVIPPTDWNRLNLQQQLREDLQRVFNISVRKEEKEVNCLIITAGPKLVYSETKYNSPDKDLEHDAIKKFLHRYPISEVLKIVSGHFNAPYIDETHADYLIDVEFPDHFDLSDTDALKTTLQNIGFIIKQEKRKIKMVVISDKQK